MHALKGFTLIELMVALAIAMIVLTVGIPGFMATIQNTRITTTLNDFVSDLSFARSEAIKRGHRVTLCKSEDAISCTTKGNWAQGWILFADANDDGIFNNQETLLRVHQAISSNSLSLTGNRNVQHYISYVSSGFSRRSSGAVQNGTLILCDSRGFGKHSRAIVINNTGRLSNIPAPQSSATNCDFNQHG